MAVAFQLGLGLVGLYSALRVKKIWRQNRILQQTGGRRGYLVIPKIHWCYRIGFVESFISSRMWEDKLL